MHWNLVRAKGVKAGTTATLSRRGRPAASHASPAGDFADLLKAACKQDARGDRRSVAAGASKKRTVCRQFVQTLRQRIERS
jgi:hypothetical protein